jgi:Caspase domain/Anaphase-promoting complex subunit 4 WD40 domain/WD domain, G-beta repeat/WD40-like Beta Propeller Repeat
VTIGANGPDPLGPQSPEAVMTTLPGLSLPGSRALLLGTATYSPASGLPAVEAAGNTVRDLGQILVERCGLAQEGLRVAVDLPTPTDMGLALAEEAERADGVLLFYYVGHGLVNMEGELFLASCLTDSRPTYLRHTALAYGSVRSSLLASGAQSIVVVLDCCFSGRALTALADVRDESALAAIHGGYVLTAAAREESALAPPGQRHTAFSGELIRFLSEGDVHGPELLRLRDAYDYLSHALPTKGFPRPRCQAREGVDALILAPNPAHRPRDLSGVSSPHLRTESASEPTCPYLGVDAFTSEQAKYFFGRERLATELLNQAAAYIHRPAPLVVIGAAGSGKSSLLGAGLLSAMEQGRPPFPQTHTCPPLLFRPGIHPVAKLAEHLAPLAGLTPSTVAEQIVTDHGSVVGLISDQTHGRPNGGSDKPVSLVIVVDQFEETFTHCLDEGERQLFVEALCAFADGMKGRVPSALVVLAVRSEFTGHLTAHPELAAALQVGRLVVRPMSADELRKAITGPAGIAGLTLEPDLVERVLQELEVDNDAEIESDTLSLLSHALLATWHRREGRTLTKDGYEAAGGIPGAAVAVTAERAYRRLNPEARIAAKRLILGMIDVEEMRADRRRADKSSMLMEAPAPLALAEALDEFAEAGTIIVDSDAAEIADDLLLRAWPRLSGWIQASQAWLRTYHRLASDAAAWVNSGREPSLLYRGSRLAAITEQAAEAPLGGYLGPLTKDFLSAASSQEKTEAAKRRRQTQRLHVLVSALAVMLVLAVTLVTIAIHQSALLSQQTKLAQYESRLAMSRQISAEADEVQAGDPQLAGQLAMVAYRIAPTTQAAGAVIESAGSSVITNLSPASITAVVLSPDGRTLATGGTDGLVRKWDITSSRAAEPVGAFSVIGPVDAMAFSPDGRILVTAGFGSAKLWDVATGQPIELLAISPSVNIYSIAVSPDGKTLAIVSGGKTYLWDVDASHLLTVLSGPRNEPLTAAEFSPDAKILATASQRGTITLFNTTTLRETTKFAANASSVATMAFSPDGRALAVGGSDGTVHLWDLIKGRLLSTLVGDTKAVVGVAFSPDGNTLATASLDGNTRVWNISNLSHPSVLAAVTSLSQITAVAVSSGAVVTAHANHSISVLSTNITQAAASICVGITVPITPDQWDQYVQGLDYHPPCESTPK